MKKLTILVLLALCIFSCTQEEQATPMFKLEAQSQGRWYKLYNIDHHEISTYTNVVKSNQRTMHEGHGDCPKLLVAAFMVKPLDEKSNLIELITTEEIVGEDLILMTSESAIDTTWKELHRWTSNEDTCFGTERSFTHNFK